MYCSFSQPSSQIIVGQTNDKQTKQHGIMSMKMAGQIKIGNFSLKTTDIENISK
jgi:hypothetical protein